jgi:hypothetical protein
MGDFLSAGFWFMTRFATSLQIEKRGFKWWYGVFSKLLRRL